PVERGQAAGLQLVQGLVRRGARERSRHRLRRLARRLRMVAVRSAVDSRPGGPRAEDDPQRLPPAQPADPRRGLRHQVRGERPVKQLAALLAGFALAGCSDSYLFDERRTVEVPADRTVALEGQFCTVGTNEVTRPIKIYVAMDASQSM